MAMLMRTAERGSSGSTGMLAVVGGSLEGPDGRKTILTGAGWWRMETVATV